MLVERDIDGRPDVRVQRSLSQILQYTHDFLDRRWRQVCVANLFPNGIFVRKVFTRQRLVYNGHARLRRILSVGEIAAAHQSRSQRCEIVRAYVPEVYFIMLDPVVAAHESDPFRVTLETHWQNAG